MAKKTWLGLGIAALTAAAGYALVKRHLQLKQQSEEQPEEGPVITIKTSAHCECDDDCDCGDKVDAVLCDTDDNGELDTVLVDDDGDGKINTVFTDSDGDGVIDVKINAEADKE